MEPKELERAVAVLTERMERLEVELRDARWHKVADAMDSLERRAGELITQLNANVTQIHSRLEAVERGLNAR